MQAANSYNNVFEVTAEYVNISGFTATGATGDYLENAGFYLRNGDYCNISYNTALDNYNGISLDRWNSYNILMNNTVSNNRNGIYVRYSNDNILTGNDANSNIEGIRMECSYRCVLANNNVSSNSCGIFIGNLINSTLVKNIVLNNYHGIRLYYLGDNKIYLNNFIDNTNNFYSYGSTNTYNSPNQITYTYNGNTHTNYLGNYYSDYTDIDSDNNGIWDNPYIIDSGADNYPLVEPFENYLPKELSALTIKVFCPVNLSVADPDGLTINPETNEIPEATYTETDINGDGDIDDIITIPDRKTGNYKITVILELDANPEDTYTLEVSANETSFFLAENTLISDIPNNPYTIESNETGIKEIIQATIDFNPDTLNKKSKGKWVTVYAELPEKYNVVDIDVSAIKLNDQVYAEITPIEIGDYDDDGIADLMVKFDRQAVIDMLPIGDAVMITVTGKLTDKMLFEGSDIIRVTGKQKNR